MTKDVRVSCGIIFSDKYKLYNYWTLLYYVDVSIILQRCFSSIVKQFALMILSIILHTWPSKKLYTSILIMNADKKIVTAVLLQISL